MGTTFLPRVTFKCPTCARVLSPAYAPPSVPNCPSCSSKMRPEYAAGAPHMRVQCPRCHTVEDAYAHDRCPKCDGAWQGFTSQGSSQQDPAAAFRGTGVSPQRGPTANNLGPVAG
jgi:hypothetical protein